MAGEMAKELAFYVAEVDRLHAFSDDLGLKLEAAEAQVEALRKMLGEAVSDILDLAHARWSEVEATDDELVGHYRAALSAPAEESVKGASRDPSPTLRAALEFYANAWTPRATQMVHPVEGPRVVSWHEPTNALKEDGGHIARAALASSTPESRRAAALSDLAAQDADLIFGPAEAEESGDQATPGSAAWIAERLLSASDRFWTDDHGRLCVTIPRELAIMAATRMGGMDTTQPAPTEARSAIPAHLQRLANPPPARASKLSDEHLRSEKADLERQWDELRDALEESGGHGGSPGESIIERLDEIDTELRRRASAAVGSANPEEG